MDVQRGISMARNEARIGSVQQVLIDRGEEGVAVGRTRGQALEVDGIVTIENAGAVGSGEFVQLRVIDAVEQDLIATIER